MTTTDRAADIRKALKARKITSRQVSVKANYFSMGSSIDVRIKDPNVPLALVREIAEQHESISRCALTGEILSGGNRYVSVEYSSDALTVLRDNHIDAVQAAVAKIHDNYLIEIGATGYLVGRDWNGHLTLWTNGGMIGHPHYDSHSLAASLGVRLVSKQ